MMYFFVSVIIILLPFSLSLGIELKISEAVF